MNNNDRLQTLKSIYQNKKLSRVERKEAMNEYQREMYKRDKRKPISIRNQTLINGITSLVMGMNFLFMGIVENLGIKYKYHSVISPVESVFILLLLACLFVYGIVHVKYKQEPDDELSQKHKLMASSSGFIFLYFILFALIIVYFTLMRHEVFVIRREAAIFLFVGIMFISKFIDSLAFLILEGRDSLNDEDEEDA